MNEIHPLLQRLAALPRWAYEQAGEIANRQEPATAVSTRPFYRLPAGRSVELHVEIGEALVRAANRGAEGVSSSG